MSGFACDNCDGVGSVRVHGPEDYGVSFESDLCESCGGTGKDIDELEAENARLRGAINSAASALDAAGRDPRRAAVVASYWLRTAFPTDHPNYLPTEAVRRLVRKAAA